MLAKHCKFSITLLGVVRNKSKVKSMDKKLLQTRERLAKKGVKLRKTLVEVGDPVEKVIEACEGFYIVSVSDLAKKSIKNYFTKNVALSIMAKSSISVLNVR